MVNVGLAPPALYRTATGRTEAALPDIESVAV